MQKAVSDDSDVELDVNSDDDDNQSGSDDKERCFKFMASSTPLTEASSFPNQLDAGARAAHRSQKFAPHSSHCHTVISLAAHLAESKASKLSSSYMQQKRAIFKNARTTHAELVAAGTPYMYHYAPPSSPHNLSH